MKKLIPSLLFILILHLTINIDNCSAQWVQLQQIGTGEIRAMAVSGNNIFASTPDSGVYRSTNNGTNWTHTALNGLVISLAVLNNYIFAGTNIQLYVSTDNGTSWTQTSLNHPASSLAVEGNGIGGYKIFAGSYIGSYPGVYLSTDNGTSWTQTSLNNEQVWALAILGNNIFAGTAETFTGTGVYLSTNNGTNWTQTALNDQHISSFAVSGNNIFAGSQNPSSGVYVSTDNGTSWTHTPLNSPITSMTASGNNVFAGAGDLPAGTGGIWLTTNNGANWTLKNEGFVITPNSSIMSFLTTSNYIFVGTYRNSVWRRSLSDILTGVQTINTETPKNFKLGQNYPNPFNPTTNIRYNLARNGFVKIVVFDALGREIETLVNENQPAGVYETNFNASNFPSGVYFYKLITNGFIETKRMVLLK